MQLQLVIPVKRNTVPRLLGVLAALLGSLAVMWLAFGLVGTLVLAALVTVLGHLLVRAARGK